MFQWAFEYGWAHNISLTHGSAIDSYAGRHETLLRGPIHVTCCWLSLCRVVKNSETRLCIKRCLFPVLPIPFLFFPVFPTPYLVPRSPTPPFPSSLLLSNRLSVRHFHRDAFLPRDAMLARYMQHSYVCLCLSVTSRCSAKKAKRRMTQMFWTHFPFTEINVRMYVCKQRHGKPRTSSVL